MVLPSTGNTTVPWRLRYNTTYLVHVLLSTYCTHVAIKYWEYDSTLVDATVYYKNTLCLLYGCLSMPQLGVMPNTTLNVSFCAWHLCPLLLLPFHQQGHLTVVLVCEFLIVLSYQHKNVVLNRRFHHCEQLLDLLRYSCCACTIVYVPYSWYCQVLGRVRTTTVPWRLPYNTVPVLYSCLSC